MKSILKSLIILFIYILPVNAACDFLVDIGEKGGKGNDDGTGRSKRAKESHFSMASTKAIRKRANNKTKKAAFDLDVAIAQSKIRNEVRQHRGNVRADVQKLKERLKKYGF